MGLKFGAHKILEKLKFGLYNRAVEHYTIYVDGELMRYKGVIASNTPSQITCESVANTSFDYMMGLVRNVEFMLPTTAKRSIIVFMDDSRSQSSSDRDLVRNLFTSKCLLNNINIHVMQSDESDLQMYLHRNRDNDLNVFITSDTDMIPLLYSHVPIIKQKLSGEPVDYSDLTFRNDYDCGQRICNNNRIYTSRSVSIKDSCLWINCGYRLIAIGCDFSTRRLHYDTRIFPVFVGMCGTNLTGSMLTETLVQGVLRADIEDIAYINSLSELGSIVAALLFVGLKNGGTLRPLNKHQDDPEPQSSRLEDYMHNLKVYLSYIERGAAPDDELVRVNVPVLCRKLLSLMGYTANTYRKAMLHTWANLLDMDEALCALL